MCGIYRNIWPRPSDSVRVCTNCDSRRWIYKFYGSCQTSSRYVICFHVCKHVLARIQKGMPLFWRHKADASNRVLFYPRLCTTCWFDIFCFFFLMVVNLYCVRQPPCKTIKPLKPGLRANANYHNRNSDCIFILDSSFYFAIIEINVRTFYAVCQFAWTPVSTSVQPGKSKNL